MSSLRDLLRSRWPTVFSALLLPALWTVFALAHARAFVATHEASLLMFSLAETLAAGFYLIRTEPKSVSEFPSDWIIAIAGTLSPLLLRPAPWGILPEAGLLIFAGAVLQLLSMASLNRSFAVVPARREIRTAWMYRIVRHPLYASYFLALTGYALVNTTLANIVICLATLGLFLARAFREEKHLALDPAYRQYMLEVRYRIVPFVF
jgi:protein-S-isoprenylcysteine O-methyltransferase Ste14